MHESGLTCVHLPEGATGLCADCQRDYDTDPQAYREYGDHPDGLARWRALQDEIAADRPAVDAGEWPAPPESGECPF